MSKQIRSIQINCQGLCMESHPWLLRIPSHSLGAVYKADLPG